MGRIANLNSIQTSVKHLQVLFINCIGKKREKVASCKICTKISFHGYTVKNSGDTRLDWESFQWDVVRPPTAISTECKWLYSFIQTRLINPYATIIHECDRFYVTSLSTALAGLSLWRTSRFLKGLDSEASDAWFNVHW